MFKNVACYLFLRKHDTYKNIHNIRYPCPADHRFGLSAGYHYVSRCPKPFTWARSNRPRQSLPRPHSAAYWNWRTFRAQQLPSLTFTSTPSLNRSISSVTLPDGGESFVHRNQLMVDAGFTIDQNVSLTGGTLFVKTALQRLDLFFREDKLL